MNEVIYLKDEARKLLDEVNSGERSPTGKLISASFNYNVFEDNSFKERLSNLKHRVAALSSQLTNLKSNNEF